MELAPIEAYQRYASLGPDFLTWLLVRVLDTDVPPPQSEPALKVDIQGPLMFAGEGGEAKKVSLAGEEAAAAPEVSSALRQGKRLMRAKIIFSAMEDTWTFTLDAETFDIKSAKLPVPNISDRDEFLKMRVESLMHLQNLVDELFENFLVVRLDQEAWKAEAQRWMKAAKQTGS